MKKGNTNWVSSLGADLGVPNTAMTLIKATTPVTKVKVLRSSMMRYPISNLTDRPVKKYKRVKKKRVYVGLLDPFSQQLERFLFEVKDAVCGYCPSVVTVERFLGRGFTAGGALAEAISMMNMGFVMTARSTRSKSRLCTSALWKNQFNRTMAGVKTLKDMYEDAKQLGVSPHQLDSYLIAVFGTGDPKCYEIFLDEEIYNDQLKQLARAKGF